jgi:hypothetical protein
MKHPEELKTNFLELRARGVSYGQIAEAIGVSKPTLVQWGKAMAEEIADLQAAERELVREKLLGNFEQWLGRQVHHFNRLDTEFGRRELKYSPTESVFRMMMASRKVLERYFFEDDRPSHPRTRNPNLNPAPAPQTDASAQSEIQNPTSEMESASPSSADGATREIRGPISICPPGPTTTSATWEGAEGMCGAQAVRPSAVGTARVNHSPCSVTEEQQRGSSKEPQTNPAKTLSFPCQDSGPHKSNLSAVADEGREMCPYSAAPHESTIATPESKMNLEGGVPRRSAPAEAESEIELEGESIPISPYESTREWLERQGITVSKIPTGARVITAT